MQFTSRHNELFEHYSDQNYDNANKILLRDLIVSYMECADTNRIGE